MPRMPRAAFSQIVNRSMSEVLTRSLATSVSTLLGCLSLLVFGGATLKDFAFALLVGIASGTYSSIFIASPVLTAWKERESGFARRRHRIADVEGAVPAFADEMEMARIEAAEEEEASAEATAPRAARPGRRAAGGVATVEHSVEGDGEPSAIGGNGATGGDGAADDGADSAERRKRQEERRARRAQRRRKHGRNR
jgi:SecD/SecF fusion protein